MPTFNDRLKQIVILLLIIGLGIVVISQFATFMPGVLGAITLYIVSRKQYFRFVYHRKWNKGIVAIGYIIFYLLLVGIPLTLAGILITPKVNQIVDNQHEIVTSVRNVLAVLQQKLNIKSISQNNVSGIIGSITAYIPKLLNSGATVIVNIAMMLFLLYFMLYYGSEMEDYLQENVPLKKNNYKLLSHETQRVVISNALGIPLISFVQGSVAAIGYLLFGVKDWGLYGFLTGVFAFFPVVGTMVVWVPLVIYMYASGDVMNSILVTAYSILVTGNIDYIARITLLKRMGDVHPVVTIIGVIVGLNLFGFVGLVFGPLMVSYLMVLYKIYMNEFVHAEPIVEPAVPLQVVVVDPSQPLTEEPPPEAAIEKK